MDKPAVLLAIVFLLATNPVPAQYLPLVAENKYWIYAEHANNDQPNLQGGYLITFGADALVGNQLYKSVLRSELSGTHPCPPPQQPCFAFDIPYQIQGTATIGFIREDTLEKKVYYLAASGDIPCGTGPQLLLDFSLAVDDTLNPCAYNAVGEPTDPTLGLIDSMEFIFLYDKIRRTLYTTGYVTYVGLPPVGPIRILEGVGFEQYGPFYYAGNRSVLVDYCEGTLNECNIISSTGSAAPGDGAAVYPNPCTNTIAVPATPGLTAIQLFDLHGQLRLRARTSDRVDVRDLPAGIYLVVLTGEGVATSMGKLVKM